jgi:ATP-dependent Lon protease
MGKNPINNLLKNMCRNAGIRDEEQKLSNHSARKTMVKKLKKNHIPETDIIQLHLLTYLMYIGPTISAMSYL